MLALVAALFFAIALLLDWTSAAGNTVFNHETLTLIGLILVSLHLAGVAAAYDWRSYGARYRRRP